MCSTLDHLMKHWSGAPSSSTVLKTALTDGRSTLRRLLRVLSRTTHHGAWVEGNRAFAQEEGAEKTKEESDAIENGVPHKELSASLPTRMNFTEKLCRENTVTLECDQESYFRNTRKRWYHAGASVRLHLKDTHNRISMREHKSAEGKPTR